MEAVLGRIQARFTKPVKKPEDAPQLPPVAVAPRRPAVEYGYQETRSGQYWRFSKKSGGLGNAQQDFH
jgi:hypothetical protein